MVGGSSAAQLPVSYVILIYLLPILECKLFVAELECKLSILLLYFLYPAVIGM